MSQERTALLALMRHPGEGSHLTGCDWSRIIGTARNANLLGKLAVTLDSEGQMPSGNARRHLTGALQLSRRQRQSVRWEAHKIDEALAPLGVPVIMLKGAAYSLAGLSAGDGRLFGDIDILVPHDALGSVEVRLMVNGWTSLKTDAYDQRFYREWTHELPPMVHARRGTVIDVHHTILPPTARHHPSPERIIERAQALPGTRCLHTPHPLDLIVHSLCHLVHEGEVHNSLRDLHDLAVLLRQFGSTSDFHSQLAQTAAMHDLGEPAALGLALVARFFPDSPAPDALDALADAGIQPRHASLLTIYDHALSPHPNGYRGAATSAAQFLLYLRAHWLRMPPSMLARHLARKAWMQWTEHTKPGPQME